MSNKSTPPSPRYLTILCEFMAFFHEQPRPYPKDHEFSEDEITAITPRDVVKFMNVKAFGKPDPGPTAKLAGAGYSSLEFVKKAISFYMPNKEHWDFESNHGNPTRSQLVKDLLARVIALGGGRKKKQDIDQENFDAAGHNMKVESDGPYGMLRRMQTQNTEYINMLNTMGMALKTFGRSVEQMKSSLERNNIAIRTELAGEAKSGIDKVDHFNAGASDGDGDGEHKDSEERKVENLEPAAAVDDAAAPHEAMLEPVDIPAIDVQMKEDVAKVAETLQEFMHTNAVTNNGNLSILSGADGFCTFGRGRTGQQMDVPNGFDLPSCDLRWAWRYWITGFPDFKVRNDADEIVDTPIRPLRFVNTSDLPHSLKKKFKDGWRPILLSMQGDVSHMLDTTPIVAIDEKFIQDSYNAAMNALVAKAPGIFSDTTASEKCGSWKVATWSRKIREQQLGQQQVRRRMELENSDQNGNTEFLKMGQEEHHPQPSPAPVAQLKSDGEQQIVRSYGLEAQVTRAEEQQQQQQTQEPAQPPPGTEIQMTAEQQEQTQQQRPPSSESTQMEV